MARLHCTRPLLIKTYDDVTGSQRPAIREQSHTKTPSSLSVIWNFKMADR